MPLVRSGRTRCSRKLRAPRQAPSWLAYGLDHQRGAQGVPGPAHPQTPASTARRLAESVRRLAFGGCCVVLNRNSHGASLVARDASSRACSRVFKCSYQTCEAFPAPGIDDLQDRPGLGVAADVDQTFTTLRVTCYGGQWFKSA